jgi:rhodanese-related sulfurtransferase
MTRVLIGLAIGLAVAAAFTHAPRATTAINLDALARDVDNESDHIPAGRLAAWLNERKPGLRIIDLRSDSEYAVSHIPQAEHMTLSQLRHAGFQNNETIVLYSAGGGHAAQGWFFLRASGLDHVYSLKGGMDEWQARRAWRGIC